MTKLANEVKTERVDIFEYPEKINPIPAGHQLTEGDLHGNSMKLMFVLIKNGIIEGINKKDYQKLVEIYKKPVEEVSEQDLIDFNTIIGKMKVRAGAEDIKLCLLGDELADRGANDYFTLKILEGLIKNKVDLEIIYSNHSYSFLAAYMRYKKGEISFDEAAAEALPADSFKSLQQLLKDGKVTMNEVKGIIENSYFPAMKLLTYSLNEAEDEITLGSHGIVDIELIKKACGELDIPFKDGSARELAETIDKMNDKFVKLIEDGTLHEIVGKKNDKYDPKKEPLHYHSALYNIMWNRKELNRPNQHKGYGVNYMHGHTSGPSEDNVVNLDNNLGKRRNNFSGAVEEMNQADYRAIRRPKGHVLNAAITPLKKAKVTNPVARIKPSAESTLSSHSYQDMAAIEKKFKDQYPHKQSKLEKTAKGTKLTLHFDSKQKMNSFLEELAANGHVFKGISKDGKNFYYSDGKTLKTFDSEQARDLHILSNPPAPKMPKPSSPVKLMPFAQTYKENLANKVAIGKRV